MINPKALNQVAQQYQPHLVDFTQRLVQTPSLPGQEADAAKLVRSEMQKLGYDQVTIDRYGNVIGHIAGGDGASLMLNGHIDHVDPGEHTGWPYPPFSGQLVNDELWGRGSVDMKGPVASMIYAPILLKALNLVPPGDIYVTAVIMEEVGGIGSSYLATHLKTDLAIVTEPSSNTLRLGHRGRVELVITVTGQSIHASIPHKGINPHYVLADFLCKLQTLELPTNSLFGASSVAPTLYHSDQNSANVTPGELKLTLDWRNIPAESPKMILEQVNALLQNCLIEGTQGSVALANQTFTTYTGVTEEASAVFPSFALEARNPLLTMAQTTLSQLLNRDIPIDIWRFATDGGHLTAAGIPTIGLGPGDETLAHTNQERIPISALTEAMTCYAALSLVEWPSNQGNGDG